MSIPARLKKYFFPLDHGGSVLEHRAENLSVAEANRQAAKQLLAAERVYWANYMRRATCHGDLEYGMDQLEELDRMEARHG